MTNVQETRCCLYFILVPHCPLIKTWLRLIGYWQGIDTVVIFYKVVLVGNIFSVLIIGSSWLCLVQCNSSPICIKKLVALTFNILMQAQAEWFSCIEVIQLATFVFYHHSSAHEVFKIIEHGNLIGKCICLVLFNTPYDVFLNFLSSSKNYFMRFLKPVRMKHLWQR